MKLSPDGGSYRVSTGDELLLELPETGSSGYIWHREPADGVSLVDEEVLADRSSPPGTAAVHRFRFRVDSPGDLQLRLTKARPWAMSQPSQTVEIMLDAKGTTAPPNP